jgi:hypothetical protein
MPEEIDPYDGADEMANGPARAAFEAWYGHHVDGPVSADAWNGLGEHQQVWVRVADAAINAHIEAIEQGPRVDAPE